MDSLSIILIIAGFGIALYFNTKSRKSDKVQHSKTKPDAFISNDKIVLVEGCNRDEIIKAAQHFCDMYNQEGYRALPKLHFLKEDKFAFTFPFDIDFVTFCFFVNYMKYPEGISPSPNSIGWSLAKVTDEWINPEIANKQVMLYIPKEDTEYDNVYLVSEENTGYKVDFGGRQKQTNLIQFVASPMNSLKLTNVESQDFE